MATNLFNNVKNFIYKSNRDQMRIEATQIMMNAESFKEYLKAFIKVFGMSLEVITTRWYLVDLVIYTILTWIADINEWKIFGILTASVVVCSFMVLIYRFFRWINTLKVGKYLFALVSIILLASLIGCSYKSEPKVDQEVKVISKEDQNKYESIIKTHNDRVDLGYSIYSKVYEDYDQAMEVYNTFLTACEEFIADTVKFSSIQIKNMQVLRKTVEIRGVADFMIYHSDYIDTFHVIENYNK